jgi:hypothetical protein
MVFNSVPGTFAPMSWNGYMLNKPESVADERGRRQYDPPLKLAMNEDQNNPLLLGQGLKNLFSLNGSIDDDEDEWKGNVRGSQSSSDNIQSSSTSRKALDSSKLEIQEILSLFRGVSTPSRVRKAFHIFLVFNHIQYGKIGK